MTNPLIHWPESQFSLSDQETIWKIRFHYADTIQVNQHVGEETMTQQHMAESTDINHIMKRYEQSGLLEHVNQYQGEYGDFTVMPDFHTAMNKIKEAEDMFLTIPASIREKFDNDPGKFVEFATNSENLGELREMGLAPPEVVESQHPTTKAKKAEKTVPSGDNQESQAADS